MIKNENFSILLILPKEHLKKSSMIRWYIIFVECFWGCEHSQLMQVIMCLKENVHSGLAKDSWDQTSGATYQPGGTTKHHITHKLFFGQAGRHIRGQCDRELLKQALKDQA